MTTVAVSMLAAAVVGPPVLVLASATTLARVRADTLEVVAVTALTGLTLGLVLARPVTDAVVLLPLAVLGNAAAVVDAREGRLPDLLTTPLLGCTLLSALFVGDVGTVAVVAAAGAAGAALLKIAASDAVGWGDVKLVPTLAVVLTHLDVVARGAALVCLLLAVSVVAVALADSRSTGGVVPYGPALVFGTIGAAVV